ncbi:MAG: 2-polyprenyl-3-methyl-5-hydroxy-6-metoxy-1,4-benzoquinol methylase [Pirellulaceae bacterium]|jgi:2-polyprenyl-3-methyl-5-hydroxy-6-metoxy-1,4-benzoquinol methylase
MNECCCDLCHQSDFETISNIDRRGDELKTAVCKTCGLVSHAQIPSEQELRDYYASEYRQDYHGEYHPSTQRVVREWEKGRRILKQLTPYLEEGDKVFEIGAGIGCTVKNFELGGYESNGCEPGEGFANYSSNVLKTTVVPGELKNLPRTSTYDFVLLVHVLEHLSSPTSTLRHIWQMLNPGGRLYVEVPNYTAPHAAPGQAFHFAHLYNFNPATLRMIGQSCGFEVTQLTHDRQKNLGMVMHRVEKENAMIDQRGYEMSIHTARKNTWFSYHCRWRYLTDRIQRLYDRTVCRISSDAKLKTILADIETHQANKAPAMKKAA